MLTMTRWNPFDEMATFRHELDRMWGGNAHRAAFNTAGSERSWVPAAEVTSTDEGWTIKMGLPGIDPKGVNVELEDRVLTITGERHSPEAADKTEKHLSEFGYGRFRRSFTVPDTVGSDNVSAAFDNGMLTVTLPLSEATKPRQIAITGAKVA